MFLQIVTILLLVAGGLCDDFDRVCKDLVMQYNCREFQLKTLCGSDGKVYNTECDFAKAHCYKRNLSIIKEGRPCHETTTRETTTLMPTTATTFKETTTTTMPVVTTPTTAETSTVTMTTLDPIKCQVLITASCPSIGPQVCGTDAKTYINRCEFEKQKCQTPSINIEKDGPCQTFSILCRAVIAATCPPTVDPICGDDNKTYNNLCEQQKVKCTTNNNLQIAHNGKCA